MSSPETKAGPHSYEPVPCTVIPPEENVTSQDRVLRGNIQPISYGPNGYPIPPMNASGVPQNTLSPAIHQAFVRKKTQELAILLIVTSIVQFLLGIGTLFTTVRFILFSGVPFWGLVFYLFAGMLTIAVQRSPSICLVRGSLALNILGAVISFVGIIMVCLDIVSATIKCPVDTHYRLVYGRPIQDIVVFSFSLITNLLLFCVSTSIAVFGCYALSSVSPAPQMHLVQNDVVAPAPTSGFPASPVVFTQFPPPCTVPVGESNQRLP